jgi:starch synthase
MKANKVLFITTEMIPYVAESPLSIKGQQLPQLIQEMGHEIRTFSPNWGIINERRNQLHEVIRLSGMNIIIDDTDHPLLIKVASLQNARMQIYFIDNDDYFTRKGIVADETGKEYHDNGERSIFYVRGVLETMKKLRWIPDIIHCQGWASAIAPLLIKRAYQDEPSFCDSKVVVSVSASEFKTDLGDSFQRSVPFRDITTKDISDVCTGNCTYTELAKIAIKFADGVVFESKRMPSEITTYAKTLGKPTLAYQGEENYAEAYSDFYDSLMDAD